MLTFFYLKKLRLFTLILTFSIFCFSPTAIHAQNKGIDLNLTNVSLETAIKSVEQKTDYVFFYNNAEIDLSRKVTIKVTNTSINSILTQMLPTSKYKIEGNKIIILSTTQQQVSKEVSGIIKDENGETLIGVTVVLKGTQNGTITDSDGRFTIKTSSTGILVFTYMGYEPQEISVKNETHLNVVMVEKANVLDDVVVVGYGTMKKRDLTGAVSSIKMDDAPVGTVSSVGHLLSGTAAGLQVNTISAQPGGGISINVRGATSVGAGNDPLIVIDGFPVSSSGEPDSGNRYEGGSKDFILGALNPNDIESIEVLKDASSTAIYGARAGHGVIIITTKRGKKGVPLVKYSGTVSVQKMKDNYELLNARDYMTVSNEFVRERFYIDNKIAPYGNRSITEFPAENIPYVYTQEQINNPVNDTRWLNEITRTGLQHQHNVSLNGGTDATQYQATLNYFKQDGIIKKNDIQRINGRINLDQKISERFKIGLSIMMNQNDYNNVPLGTGANEYAGIIRSAVQFSPLLPIRNDNGEFVVSAVRPLIPNPVSLLDITDKSIDERVLAVYFAEYKPINGLLLKINAGIDRKYRKRSTYIPRTTLYGKNAGGEASINQYDNRDYLMDLTATYNKQIAEHKFTILAGHSYQQFNSEGFNAGNKDFLTDSYLYNNIGAGDFSKPTVGSWKNKNTMASFFGRANYSLYDRYLLTFTLRADGASNLAKGNQWGYFPSVSAAWRFSDESFMSGTKNILSNGKIRFGYGETGNSNIGNGAIDYYQPSAKYIYNGTAQGGVVYGQIGNKSLTWETTKEYNFGLDIGLFNKVNITSEIYSREIADLLTRRNLMSYYFVSDIADNIGSTQSKGFELTINSQNIDTKDFKWNTILTYSFYRDKWKKRADTWNPASYERYDDPLRAAFGYRADGLIKEGETVDHMPGSQPGQIKLKDTNSFQKDENGNIVFDKDGRPIRTGMPDGKLDESDKEFLGSMDPDFLMGLSNTFQYKKWDLNIYLYGAFNMLRGETYLDWGSMGGSNILADHNFPSSMKDVWRSDNLTGKYPGYTQANSPYGNGDYFYKKISYVRVRNITLGYNIPMKKIMSNIRCYVDVNNPFLFTNYKGIDPETDFMGTYYVDVSYPNTRTFTFGIDITF